MKASEIRGGRHFQKNLFGIDLIFLGVRFIPFREMVCILHVERDGVSLV